MTSPTLIKYGRKMAVSVHRCFVVAVPNELTCCILRQRQKVSKDTVRLDIPVDIATQSLILRALSMEAPVASICWIRLSIARNGTRLTPSLLSSSSVSLMGIFRLGFCFTSISDESLSSTSSSSDDELELDELSALRRKRDMTGFEAVATGFAGASSSSPLVRSSSSDSDSESESETPACLKKRGIVEGKRLS